MNESALQIEAVTCVSPLRWAGGKRKLLPFIQEAIGSVPVDRLVEPFMGGGSVLLGTPARRAAGSDINASLMTFYVQCRDNVSEVLDALSSYADTRDDYYSLRSARPTFAAEVAARFIFLNRTSYMGLHRTNLQGEFNVPYGGGGRYDFDALSVQLRQLSNRLQGVELRNEGFVEALARVDASDMVFLDPPYGVTGDLPFRRYGAELFTLLDHARLAIEATRCAARGAQVFVTLPGTQALIENFSGWSVLAERRSRTGVMTEVCITSDSSALIGQTARPVKGMGGWSIPVEPVCLGERSLSKPTV